MSGTVAILGANGFIGRRLVEYLHLRNLAQVRPVVRRPNALAGLAVFDLDSRIADALDAGALERALTGCDVLVHCVAGDAKTIVGAVGPAYAAAQRAGVRRLVYLSSASVHGQAPPPGTHEGTPLRDDQPIAYNNAKVRAERQLQKLRTTGDVELVILRPGIVTGPRSFWVESFASALVAGTASLVNGGKGICNSLYVDNLAHAVHLAMRAREADGHAFLLGDAETVLWADLYRPVAAALGFDLADVPTAVYRAGRTRMLDRIELLQQHTVLGPWLARIPKRLRRIAYAALVSPAQDSPQGAPWAHPDWSVGEPETPTSTLEMDLLGRCDYKLPQSKAQALLGYEPIVRFDEGMRRTLGWLRFAGFPFGAGHSTNP
ncbi:MAG: NAD-dependent epimerase/dehydratase family protein [Gammaproteobacteria bacterium]|nr:NAD-dependent epimerase/dehydratase family protein [Gammaproteobacteria bacterium]